MQTTSITVVSESCRVGKLEDVAEYIETQCPYLCIDMTTALEDTPGDYKDVVIPTMGPFLVQKSPLLGWSPGINAVLKSQPWGWVRFFLTIINFFAVTIVFFIKDYLDVNTRMGIFLSGALIQSLLNFLEFSNYQKTIMKEVMKKFEFWYLAVVHTVAIVGMGWLYIASDLEPWSVFVGLLPYVFTFPFSVFAIDGSCNSPKSRSITMMLWLAVYFAFGVGCGVLGFSSNPSIHLYFVNYRIDLFFMVLTAQSAVVVCNGILVLHFAKYAVMMWRGRMYVLVYFEIQTGKHEIGTITQNHEVDAEGVDMNVVDEGTPHGGGGSQLPAGDSDTSPLNGSDTDSNISREGSYVVSSADYPLALAPPNPNLRKVTMATGSSNGSSSGGFKSFSLGRHQSNVKFSANLNKRQFSNAKIMKSRAPRVKSFVNRNPLSEMEESMMSFRYDYPRVASNGSMGASDRDRSVRFLNQGDLAVTSVSTNSNPSPHSSDYPRATSDGSTSNDTPTPLGSGERFRSVRFLGIPWTDGDDVAVTRVSSFGSRRSLVNPMGQGGVTSPPGDGAPPSALRQRRQSDRTESPSSTFIM